MKTQSNKKVAYCQWIVHTPKYCKKCFFLNYYYLCFKLSKINVSVEIEACINSEMN